MKTVYPLRLGIFQTRLCYNKMFKQTLYLPKIASPVQLRQSVKKLKQFRR